MKKKKKKRSNCEKFVDGAKGVAITILSIGGALLIVLSIIFSLIYFAKGMMIWDWVTCLLIIVGWIIGGGILNVLLGE